jgi:hypothetical protein
MLRTTSLRESLSYTLPMSELKVSTSSCCILSVESDLAAKREEAGLAESTEAWLLTLRERLSEVEEDTGEAFERRRQLVKLLVARITAGKDEDGRPDVRITYRFGPPEPAHEEAMFAHGIHSATRK